MSSNDKSKKNVVLTEEPVVLKKAITPGKSYTFFYSSKHGDVFVHLHNLIYFGFDPGSLRGNVPAVIDIVFLPDGRTRAGTIHQIGSSPSSNRVTSRRKNQNQQKNKSTWSVGTSSQGVVKIIKEGFGFIEDPNRIDLFFAMSCVEPDLITYLKTGSEVCFDVESCDRGVMARINEIVWPESQLTRSVVCANEKTEQYIHQVTDPTGANKLEIRNGRSVDKSEVLKKPKSLHEAKQIIDKKVVLRVV